MDRARSTETRIPSRDVPRSVETTGGRAAPRRAPVVLSLCVFLFVAAACGAGDSDSTTDPQGPTGVVLFVGDGVGTAYWSAAHLALDSLAVADFPVKGWTDTRNVHDRVTDSAASGTALATGQLTYNGAIGVGPDSSRLETVLEYARDQGLATGLVTTSRVTHATPAAFAAHVEDRDREGAIAEQLADSGVDVLLGGGRRYFDGTGDAGSDRNLIPGLRRQHAYVESADALRALDPDTVETLYGFLTEDDPARAGERDFGLDLLTERALAVLRRNPDGFLLMVEAAQPDWRGHDAASLERVQAEMADFEGAIREALSFREARPRTLTLVVSDHETGGLALGEDSTGAVRAYWATGSAGSATDHTATLTPLFGIGPGSERFRGLHRVDEVGRRLESAVRSVAEGR